MSELEIVPYRNNRRESRSQREGWDRLTLGLYGLYVAVAAYSVLRKWKAGNEYLEDFREYIHGVIATARGMREAGQKPDTAFFPLPPGRKRTRLVEAYYELMGKRDFVFAHHPSVHAAREWSLGGKGLLAYQQVRLSTPFLPGGNRLVSALVGESNRMSLINPLDPNQEEKMGSIISLYPLWGSSQRSQKAIDANTTP